jgi:hypothetical protein
MKNEVPSLSVRNTVGSEHTEKEYTFRMAYDGPLKAGQFFLVSLPKFGESPIFRELHGPRLGGDNCPPHRQGHRRNI